jgi:hypothetical protein
MRQAIKSGILGRFFYGNLKDSDRIFTNVYKDGDPYINGALKRVNPSLFRAIGTAPKTSWAMVLTGVSTRLKNQGCADGEGLVSLRVSSTPSCPK